jgi:hypothetical protein
MGESETLSSVVEPEYLTDVLRRCGALRDGRVCRVVVESSKSTVISRIIRVCLFYDCAASGAPSSIILKTGLSDRAGRNGIRVARRSRSTTRSPPRCRHLWCRAASMPSGTMTRTNGTCCSRIWRTLTSRWHLGRCRPRWSRASALLPFGRASTPAGGTTRG